MRSRRARGRVLILGLSAALAAFRAANGETGPLAAPDTVLARVGPRSITVSDFRRAWRESHASHLSERLTPEAARGFLEVLVDRELIAAAATREPWAWTPAESAAYQASTDRLALAAVLDSVLDATRAMLQAAGAAPAEGESPGIAARERVVATLAPRFDANVAAAVAARFAALPRPTSDSSLTAQLRMLGAVPALLPADTALVLARSAVGPYRVAELIADWGRLPPVYRPRLDSAAAVEQMVTNGLFERWLRATARARRVIDTPEVAVTLERQREGIAIDHLMDRDVHGTIVPDPAALRRWHRDHAEDYRVPERYLVVRLTLGDRDAAERMAMTLRDPAAAETLVARGRRSGVDYTAKLGQDDDPEWFARIRRSGTGSVLGPEPEGDAWVVLRVEALLPARVLSYDEAHEAVFEAWYADQSAARLRALIERERRHARVRVEPRALVGLTEP